MAFTRSLQRARRRAPADPSVAPRRPFLALVRLGARIQVDPFDARLARASTDS
jgi:hypothetical protein